MGVQLDSGMRASLLLGLVASSAIKEKVRSFSSKGNGFKITLACDFRCDEIEDSIKASAGFIENALVLSKQIVVEATYRKKSDEGLWKDGKSLGVAVPELITKIEGSMSYQAPRALIKQVTRRRFKDEPDIILHINPNVEMFVPDGIRQQSKHQYSLLDVLSHELLHGMGFFSSFGKLARNTNISPDIVRIDGNQTTDVVDFRISCFDKFIYTTKGPISDYIDQMNEYRTLPRPRKHTAEYELLEPHVKITSEIERFASESRSLYFKVTNGTPVYLETSRRYVDGSSITHLDSAYRNTQDELMVSSAKLGNGVHHRARDQTWVTSPYGPDTLAILETMGYKLNGGATFENSLGGYMASKYPSYVYPQPAPHVTKPSKEIPSRKTRPSHGNDVPSKGDKRIPPKLNSLAWPKNQSPKVQTVDLQDARAKLRTTKKV